MERNILFFVNPNSGKKNSDQIISIINAHIPKTIRTEIGKWTTIEEFNVLAEQLKQGLFTEAVAVGGDGSVNLVARTILNSGLTLGIVPSGSGNGLARSLGISMNTAEAVKQIVDAKTAVIDSGMVNGIPFFCTTGLGFDAHIGNLFAGLPKRGLNAYVKLIAKEFFLYKAQDYELLINGKSYNRKAFLITVANAGQYGNDFYIAPQAKMNDGQFHVVVLKPFNLLQALALTVKIMRRKAHESRFTETFTGDSLVIKRQKDGAIHYDGEPEMLGTELSYAIRPGSLRVIVGTNYPSIK